MVAKIRYERKKELKKDYIPNGEEIRVEELEFRKVGERELFQCCKPISHDPQSGPIYCGDQAKYIADVYQISQEGVEQFADTLGITAYVKSIIRRQI